MDTGTPIALEILPLHYFIWLTTLSGMQPGEEDKMNAVINPELAELRQQVATHDKEIAELRGNMQQINKLVSSVHRQSTLQIAAIVISLCLTIAGGYTFRQMRSISGSSNLKNALTPGSKGLKNVWTELKEEWIELSVTSTTSTKNCARKDKGSSLNQIPRLSRISSQQL